jgi:phage internal scaffolding protein
MKQVEKTGMLPENKIGNAFYGDVSEISDFNACQQIVMIAEQSFKELDPNLRERFDNDPGALIDFLEDPDNKAEAIELGLVKPDTVEEVKVPPEASKVPPAAK